MAWQTIAVLTEWSLWYTVHMTVAAITSKYETEAHFSMLHSDLFCSAMWQFLLGAHFPNICAHVSLCMLFLWLFVKLPCLASLFLLRLRTIQRKIVECLMSKEPLFPRFEQMWPGFWACSHKQVSESVCFDRKWPLAGSFSMHNDFSFSTRALSKQVIAFFTPPSAQSPETNVQTVRAHRAQRAASFR